MAPRRTAVFSLACFTLVAEAFKTLDDATRMAEPTSDKLGHAKLDHSGNAEEMPSQGAAVPVSKVGYRNSSDVLVEVLPKQEKLVQASNVAHHLDFKRYWLSNPWKKYAGVDSIGRATGGLLDNFVVCYWSGVLLMCALTVYLMAYYPNASLLFVSAEGDANKRRASVQPGASGFATRELEADLWSFTLASAYGQVHDSKGRKTNPLPWYCIAFVMGGVQLVVLSLILHDLNPNATPWTTKPSAPWLESPISVNCMKFLMIIFQILAVTTEASGAYKTMMCAANLDPNRITGPASFPMIAACLHYAVTLGTVLGAVSVVLSCQQTPSILYNSLAILFVTQVDELVFKFFNELFNFSVDWCIPVSFESAEATMSWKGKLVRQIFVGFPMVFGFSVLGRAWYTNMMPVSAFVGAQLFHAISRS